MTLRQVLILTALLGPAASAAHGDEITDASARLDLDRIDSVYPDRWCITTFIDRSRKIPVHRTSGIRTAETWAASTPVFPAVSYAAYSGNSSLANRLLALRTLRIATLWRGRQQALVFGVNESGYLGVRLDEIDTSRR